jgi:hypothetical protein
LGERLELILGVWVRRLREQLDNGAWQGAHTIVRVSKKKSIHALTAQLFSCAETH